MKVEKQEMRHSIRERRQTLLICCLWLLLLCLFALPTWFWFDRKNSPNPTSYVTLPNDFSLKVRRRLLIFPLDEWGEGKYIYSRYKCPRPPQVVLNEIQGALQQKGGRLESNPTVKNDDEELSAKVTAVSWPKVPNISRKAGQKIFFVEPDESGFVTFYFWGDGDASIIESVEAPK